VLGVAVIHLAGLSWLGPVAGLSPARAFALGSLPFWPGDGLKVLAALAASRVLSPRA
jgi:biotin transport system substrate-specific component